MADEKSASLKTQPGAETSPSVVITGASSGIGRASAILLDRKGYRVFAGVRRSSDGDALREATSARLTPLLLDVTDPHSIAAARITVEAKTGSAGLAALVNNAGISVSAILEFLDLDALRHQLEVNLIGTIAVTQAFLPSIRQAEGRIVNVSSDSGLIATPFMGPYAISKFGVEAFSDVLRRELRRSPIDVVIVEPGAIATPMWGKGQSDADRVRASMSPDAVRLYGDSYAKFADYLERGSQKAIPVERVAQAIHRAIASRRPKPRVQVGGDAKGARWLSRFLPTRVVDRIIGSAMG